MFGSIPNERIHAHDWRGGSVQIGELSGRFVDETTQGAADWPMPMGDEIDEGEATLPARQIAFVHAHATVVLGGYPASEVNARRHKGQAFRKLAANRSQYIPRHT